MDYTFIFCIVFMAIVLGAGIGHIYGRNEKTKEVERLRDEQKKYREKP